jgi:hypothetical protein
MLSQTKKTISDIQTDAQSKVTAHAALTATHGVSGTIVGTTDTQTLSGKTLTSPTIGDFTYSTHAHTAAGSGGQISHLNLSNIGSNTHALIDTHVAASAAHNTAGNIVGTTDTQPLTNKTITDATNNVMAKSLKSATTVIDVSASAAPAVGNVLTATGSTTATWQTPAAGVSAVSMYGDGSDGDVTISTNTVLTTDKFYNSLIINASINLDTDGYRVFIKNTLTVNGTIHCNGVAATSGNTGATGRVAHSLGGSGAGGNGGPGTNAGGGGAGGGVVFVAAKTVIINSTGIISSTGGTGKSATNSSVYGTGAAGQTISEAYGGNGGGGGAVQGTGGGAGGIATQAASRIPRNLLTATLLAYSGGAGGGGGSGKGTDSYVNSNGGGGGGGGGTIVIITSSYTNSGTLVYTGGAGGSPSGGNGVAGAAGSVGKVVQLTI